MNASSIKSWVGLAGFSTPPKKLWGTEYILFFAVYAIAALAGKYVFILGMKKDFRFLFNETSLIVFTFILAGILAFYYHKKKLTLPFIEDLPRVIVILLWTYLFARMIYSPFAGDHRAWLMIDYLLAAITAVLRREVFFLLIPFFIWIMNMETIPLSSYQYDYTDMAPLLNLTPLLCCFELIKICVNKKYSKLNSLVFMLFAGAMISALYFFPGMEKMFHGNGFYNWIRENNFTYTVGYYFNFGGDVFGGDATAKTNFISFSQAHHIVIQFVILAFELLFVFFILHKRMALALFVISVIFHFSFFIFSGILFWKWVVITGLILYLFHKSGIYKINIGGRIIFLYLLLMTAREIFFVPELGWDDPKKVVHYQWAYKLPLNKKLESKNPFSFSDDSFSYITLNPACFFPYEKNIGMSWKFSRIKNKQQLDEFINIYRHRAHQNQPPLYNHLWFKDNYFDNADSLGISQSKLTLIKREIEFSGKDYSFKETARGRVIYEK